ncbi:uncharacterized protein BDW43DRAFT_238940 [Aspergillus alliaceus]|uniref:uncharacterized protein n=1 Tax=Petromyces alliaceus TaxID=209559 RepID=UPI0012A3BFA8|nr:uncharacterized protein BDW43DRAFT_238940 [Aspergillus alliaceus]KAB8227656.1 hypothetical protein BDW43DRAFT_238940 [Aspergillus alliaceus]
MAPVDDESSVTMPSYSTRLDKAQILLEADEFVTKHNLHDARDLIRKGALLFYDLHDYTRVEDLTEDEIAALHNGKENAGSSTAWAFCGLAGLL